MFNANIITYPITLTLSIYLLELQVIIAIQKSSCKLSYKTPFYFITNGQTNPIELLIDLEIWRKP